MTFEKSNMANGMWLSNDGRHLLVAEQGTSETPGGVSQISVIDKQRTVLVHSYHGLPFNSPNKVIQSKNGIIYFSDPDYGYHQKFKPKPQLPNAVYAFDPKSKKLERLSTQFVMPHGLAFSSDEKIIYVGDTGAVDGEHPYNANSTHDIFLTYLENPYRISSITLFQRISPGIPDGFITDEKGDLYVAAGDGVQHYSNQGNLINTIPIPGGAVNLTFCQGGIYVTADDAIYRFDI